jgi:hypothetical protein
MRAAQMLQRGVDNLITSDPDLAIRVRERWNHLTPAERLVLSARLLLGVEFSSDPGPVQPSAPHDG